MNIFIIGTGEIGTHIARFFCQEKHDVFIFEINDERARELEETIDARIINGDGTSVSDLTEADVSKCEIFFAVTSDNNVNLVSCSLAKKMGAEFVICRVHPGFLIDEWKFDYRGHFGIDYIFSPERLSAVALAKFIKNPEAVMVEELARGKIEMQQLTIPNQDDPRFAKMKLIADGKMLKEIKLPERVRFGAITRGESTKIPMADDILAPSDVVTLFGSHEKMAKTMSILGFKKQATEEKNIVIYSGSDYGFSLAQILSGFGHRIRIIEANTKKCEFLAAVLKNVTIINADSTSLQVLKEEQVGEADFFIACSLADEDNVMTCIQAHNLGAKKCLTLVHRADYADAISASAGNFGIAAAISPREATRKEMMRFITTEEFHRVKEMQGGELLEFTLKENSQLVGKKIAEINWPQHCIIVAQISGINANVPSAIDTLNARDKLYVMIAKESIPYLVKLLKA